MLLLNTGTTCQRAAGPRARGAAESVRRRFSNSIRGGSVSLTRCLAVLLTIALVLSSPGAATAAEVDLVRVQSAADWLATQQDESGGFIGFTGEPDPSLTADAVIALSAAERVGADVELQAALDFLGENGLVLAQTGPGSAAKFSLALSSAGVFTRDFNGVDPLSIVEVAADGGMIGNGPFDHALGLLALAAAGSEVPEVAVAAALESQLEDGSWSFDGTAEEGAGDSNTTALMVQALVAVGLDGDDAISNGANYLLSVQTETGSFAYQPTLPGDSNSTGLSVSALFAIGNPEDNQALQSGLEALVEFQNANGSISWMMDPRDDNLFSTVQGVPALAHLALPLPALVDAMAATPEATPEATPQS